MTRREFSELMERAVKGAFRVYNTYPDYAICQLNALSMSDILVGAFEALTPEDISLLALAAGSRRAKTPKAVECEASQSGGDSRNAPEQPR